MSSDNETRIDNELSKLLHKPDVPDGLEQSLLVNFEKQQLEELQYTRKKNRRLAIITSGLAAGLVMGITLILENTDSISPVKMAYAHAQEEKLITGHKDGGYESWLSENGIHMPANADAVVLSKNCVVGDSKAKHLRFEITSNTNGNQEPATKQSINMFIHSKSGSFDMLHASSGDINGQRWLLFKPDNNLQVLVVYENESYRKDINTIMKSMFPDKV